MQNFPAVCTTVPGIHRPLYTKEAVSVKTLFSELYRKRCLIMCHLSRRWWGRFDRLISKHGRQCGLQAMLVQMEAWNKTKSVRKNSLWPIDATRRHGSWSTLAQIMACCMTAPIHYLNQCWLVISARDFYLRATSSEIPQPSFMKTSFNLLEYNFFQISQGPMS